MFNSNKIYFKNQNHEERFFKLLKLVGYDLINNKEYAPAIYLLSSMQNDCLEFGYISVNSFKQLVFEKYPSYKLDNFKFYLAKDFYNFNHNKKKISISEYVSNLDDCEKEVLIQALKLAM